MCVFQQDGEVGGEVPLCVRRKATEAGFAIHARSWRSLPEPARRRLVSMPSTGPLERSAYASVLQWVLETFGRDGTPPTPALAAPPWRSATPPSGFADVLAKLGLDWGQLSLDARFALHETSAQGLGAVHRAASALRTPSGVCAGLPCIPLDALVRRT